jgi:hypothetical protein
MYKTLGVFMDSFSPPKPFWQYIAGTWEAGTLRQTASDVPDARAGFVKFIKRDWEFENEAKPTLVDASPRFLGGFAREFAGLTHYMMGSFFTSTSTRLRIYKQYAGLPKITEGLVLPTLDMGFADSLILDSFADMMVRGLSRNYTVVVTYHDDSSESITSPGTYITFTVKKPIKRIDVYDVAKRLQGSNTKLSGGLDDFYLGGPGTYCLLSDSPLTWDYSRTKCWMRVKGDMIECEFTGQPTYAVDSEFTQVGFHGLRCYEAPSEFYSYRLRRWS